MDHYKINNRCRNVDGHEMEYKIHQTQWNIVTFDPIIQSLLSVCSILLCDTGSHDELIRLIIKLDEKYIDTKVTCR